MKYVGKTHFSNGKVLYGIALHDAIGENNGTIEGKKYFECPIKHGVFKDCTELEISNKV